MNTTDELHKLANAVWHYNLRGRIELAQMKRSMGLNLNHNEQRALEHKKKVNV